jgi:chromosome segregation ATPase
MIEHERVLAALQTQADTIARLERELAEARAKIEGLTVDEDWTADDHVAMVNEANAQLQAFASGLEANLAAVIQRAEAAERGLADEKAANASVIKNWEDALSQCVRLERELEGAKNTIGAIGATLTDRNSERAALIEYKADAEALRALAAWLAHPNWWFVDYMGNIGAEWRVDLKTDCNSPKVTGTGATLAAAIMDALSNANRAA